MGFSHSEAPVKLSQRTLTFADRVAYQRVIEEVYWRHRIWPDGTRSTFASELNFPAFLAFQPVPEGSTLGLLAVGALGLGLFLLKGKKPNELQGARPENVVVKRTSD